MKCSQKRSRSAQLQLSSCNCTRLPHSPDHTDICHTPGSGHIGELWHGGSGMLSLGRKPLSRAECKRPCFTVVLLQGFHSMRKETDTHAHTRGKVERDPPSVSERRAGKVNVACVCTGLQMTDGAQVPLGRRTTASLGRAIGKWWMLPSPSHIWNEIKTGKRGARCYVGCSEGSFVFHFKSVLSGHIKREGGGHQMWGITSNSWDEIKDICCLF